MSVETIIQKAEKLISFVQENAFDDFANDGGHVDVWKTEDFGNAIDELQDAINYYRSQDQ